MLKRVSKKAPKRAITTAAAILFIGVAAPQTVTSGDWANDWYSNMTQTSPGSFTGQQRGYLTAGSLSVRWPSNSSSSLLSVQPPRFKAGCGGIDAFAGSLAFLNPDMLVEKFQRILQNSAGLAFDMALQTLCPKCSDIMKSMEDLANTLNSLALDDCQAAKALVGGLKDKVFGQQLTEIKEAAQTSGISEGIGQVSSKLKSFTGDVKKWVNTETGQAINVKANLVGCDANFKTIFPADDNEYPRSMVETTVDKLGLSNSYGPLMRGWFGDIVLTGDDFAIYIPPCKENLAEGANITLTSGTGYVMPKPTSGALVPACTQQDAPMKEIVNDTRLKLDDVIAAMKNKDAAKINTLKTYLGNAPFSAHYALRMSVASGTDAAMKEELASLVGTQYAVKAMQDLFSRLSEMDRIAASIKMTAASTGPTCQVGSLMDIFEHAVDRFSTSSKKGIGVITAAGQKAIDQYIESTKYITHLYETDNRILAHTAKAFGPSVAQRINAKLRMAVPKPASN